MVAKISNEGVTMDLKLNHTIGKYRKGDSLLLSCQSKQQSLAEKRFSKSDKCNQMIIKSRLGKLYPQILELISDPLTNTSINCPITDCNFHNCFNIFDGMTYI